MRERSGHVIRKRTVRRSLDRELSARSPATTANLGPGFDCLGLALDLANDFTARPGPRLTISATGPEAAGHPHEGEDLTLQAYRKACEAAKMEPPPLLIRVTARIPVGRGLGSSAAAIAGGLALARRVAGDRLDLPRALAVGTDIEGHPDNLVAAMVGGLVVSARVNDAVLYHRILPRRRPVILVFVPEAVLPTKLARSVLPETVTRQDAVWTLSRLALSLAGWTTGDERLLGPGLEDRLHQPYRAPLVPGLAMALENAREWGAAGAFLSGAGPSIAFPVFSRVVSVSTHIARAFRRAGIPGRLESLSITPTGAWGKAPERRRAAPLA